MRSGLQWPSTTTGIRSPDLKRGARPGPRRSSNRHYEHPPFGVVRVRADLARNSIHALVSSSSWRRTTAGAGATVRACVRLARWCVIGLWPEASAPWRAVSKTPLKPPVPLRPSCVVPLLTYRQGNPRAVDCEAGKFSGRPAKPPCWHNLG